MNEPTIVLNMVKCKGCKQVLISLHRHDYRTCSCEYQIMVDGCVDYCRRGWDSKFGTLGELSEDLTIVKVNNKFKMQKDVTEDD